MKAKLRKTGEVVDVIAYNNQCTIRSHWDYVSYIDSKGVEHDRESLNYYWDFEPIDTTNDEHWQDVRERAAIAAMQGILSTSIFHIHKAAFNDTAKSAISFADALVKLLKEE